ncbi:MAG: putative deoxyribonuclease RhsC [Microgenomates bacterium OLB23]|nr:MAG: putative deoxyribonuclease RhsC [Microgenomates bacterium OLB23]
MEFDALGRMTAQYAPNPEKPGNTLDIPSSRTYFFEQGNNGLVVRSAQLISQTQDGQHHYQVADTFYDGLGQIRQAQILQTNVDGKDVRKVTQNEYHADGTTSKSYEIQTTTPVTVDADNLAAVPPQFVSDLPRVINSEVQFDALRRPVSATKIETESGQKFTSSTEYAILGTKSTDPNGVEKIALADVWGRGRYAFTQDRTKQKVLMTVNEYGKPLLDKATKTTIVDGGGTKTESVFDYDKSGRLTFSQDPSLGQYRFEYDIYGNKTLEISQPREDVGYEYDLLGRLVRKTYYNLSSGELYNRMVSDEVTYQYDGGPFALGKLTKVNHLTGSKEFSYDGGQRLRKTRVATFSNVKDFTTGYNQISQEIESTYPDGSKVQKEYDREGRVARMKVDGKDVFTGASYDKFGNQRVAQVEFQGGLYTNTNVFDTLGRLKTLGVSTKQAVIGAGVIDVDLIKQNLVYNSYSEIETLDETVSGRSTLFNYGYDGFSQLTSVQSPLYNTSYEYDLFGRMLKKK